MNKLVSKTLKPFLGIFTHIHRPLRLNCVTIWIVTFWTYRHPCVFPCGEPACSCGSVRGSELWRVCGWWDHPSLVYGSAGLQRQDGGEKKNKQKDKTNHKHTLTKQSRHFKHSHSHQYTFIAGKLIQKLRYRWYDIASFSLSSVSVLKKKLTWHFSQNLSMSIIISERGQGTSVHRKHGHKRFTVHWDIHRKFGDGWLSSI